MRYFSCFILTLLLVLAGCASTKVKQIEQGRFDVRVVYEDDSSLYLTVEKIMIEDLDGMPVAEQSTTSYLSSGKLPYGSYYITLMDKGGTVYRKKWELGQDYLEVKLPLKVPRQVFAVRDMETQAEVKNASIVVKDAAGAVVTSLMYPSQKELRLPEGDYIVEVTAPGYAPLSQPRLLDDGEAPFLLVKDSTKPPAPPPLGYVRIGLLPVFADTKEVISSVPTRFTLFLNGDEAESFTYPEETSCLLRPDTEYVIGAVNAVCDTFWSQPVNSGYKDIAYNIPMQRLLDDPPDSMYYVSFYIYDSETEESLDDVDLSIDGVDYSPWSNHNWINLPEGEHIIRVEKRGYIPFEEDFYVESPMYDCDLPMDPIPPEKTYEITFNVKDDKGNKLSGYTLKVDGKKRDSSKVKLKKDQYSYSVSKVGYKTELGKLTADKDKTVNIVMKPDVPPPPPGLVPFTGTKTYSAGDNVIFKLKDSNSRYTLKFTWTENGKTKTASKALGKPPAGTKGLGNSYSLQSLVKEKNIKSQIKVTCQ